MGKIIAALVLMSMLNIQASFASETVSGVKKDFQSLKKELSEQLAVLDGRIKELKEKGKEKSSAIHEKTVKELEEAQEKLRAEIKELKDDGKTSWQSFKDSFAKSLDTLNEKVQKALKD